jgi:hypothetical protein
MLRLLVPALIALLLAFGPGASAQANCTLTPLTLPLFGGTPIADLATPQASPAAITLSEQEAMAVLEMYVACTNTGDPTLVWAMFTPRWFSTQFADSGEHYLPAFEYEIATGNAPVIDPLVLESVDKVERLDDGRYGVTATFSSGELRWTDQLILANIDGQWLIDDVVLVSPST